MHTARARIAKSAVIAVIGIAATGAAAATLLSFGAPPAAREGMSGNDHTRASTRLSWRLNNPDPIVVPDSRANPAAVADKFAKRALAMESRSQLRAYEGAPPVIPHAIDDLNVQSCRACHAQGLNVGAQVAKMVSHTYLTNCTQCHVEASVAADDPRVAPSVLAGNSFAGLRASGYGGTRAWAGAPPVMPHSVFMRTNCVSCHGEHGYDGWRPDHLSRTNCIQCHAPAAEFDQLSPTFGEPDVPDGVVRGSVR